MPDSETADAVTEDIPAAPPDAPAPRRRVLGPLLLVSGLLLVGLPAFRLFGPKPIPPPKVIAYSPQQAAEAHQHLDALSAQLTAPMPAAPPPEDRVPQPASIPPPAFPRGPRPPSVVRLQLSQADLNAYLATDRKVKGLLRARGIRAVQVLLQPPHNVVLRAAVLYKGHPANVQIKGALLPSPDTVARLDATQAQVGSLPLPPKVVTAQADRIAAQFLGRLRGRMPVQVQTIEVVDGHLILTGLRRPPATTSGAADSRRSESPARR